MQRLVEQRFPKPKKFCYIANLEKTEAHDEVGCALSSYKNGYSLQRLVAKMEYNVTI